MGTDLGRRRAHGHRHGAEGRDVPVVAPRESTNLRQVAWTGTLAMDGSLAVEVHYDFFAEALENDPDRPRAGLTTGEEAVRTRVNGHPDRSTRSTG